MPLDFYRDGAVNIEAELELHKLTGWMDELQQKIEGYQKWITGVAGTAGQRQSIRERDSAREQLHRLEERKSILEARTRSWREIEYPQWDKACQEVRRRIAQWRSEHAAQVPAESVIESQGAVLSFAESMGSTKLTAKQQDLSNGFDAAQLPPPESPVEAPPVSEPRQACGAETASRVGSCTSCLTSHKRWLISATQ